jgi:hypothetical protein
MVLRVPACVRCVLVSACALASFAACATQPDTATIRGALQQRYATYDQALALRDGKTLETILAANYVSDDILGRKLDGTLFLDQMLAFPRDPNMKTTATIRSLRLDGNVAIVEVTSEMRSILKPRGVGPIKVRILTYSTDKWLLENGVWLYESNYIDGMDEYQNGKSVLHKMRDATQTLAAPLASPSG